MVLADALPRLVSLSFSYIPASRYARVPSPGTRPTIGALVALARACPHLARLRIPDIDVNAGPTKDAIPALDHKLRELEITAFSTHAHQDAFGIADKVHRLFPNLRNVQLEEAWSSGSPGYKDSLWNITKAYLSYLQAIRVDDGRSTSNLKSETLPVVAA